MAHEDLKYEVYASSFAKYFDLDVKKFRICNFPGKKEYKGYNQVFVFYDENLITKFYHKCVPKKATAQQLDIYNLQVGERIFNEVEKFVERAAVVEHLTRGISNPD